MNYQIEWKPSALREFKKLPTEYQESVRREIETLSTEPRPGGCRKLAGHDQIYRIRLGSYRLIYEIEDKIVTVHILRIRPRGDSYRGL